MDNKEAFDKLAEAVTYLQSKGIDSSKIYEFVCALISGKSLEKALEIAYIDIKIV